MKAGGSLKFIIAILIFSAVILFHELGHFLLAKKNGVGVIEFSLGMGPRLISTVRGGTRYSVKLFPLGGSCLMQGEDSADDEEGSFNSASVWGRISIIAAGPVFNFILAFIFAVIIVAAVGYEPAVVLQVQKGSPAAQAGLLEGDLITEFQGYSIDLGKDVYLYQTLYSINSGDTISLTYERDGQSKQISYVPEDYVRYLMGVNFESGSLEVASLSEGMPAMDSGIMPGDTMTSINGNYFESLEAYSEYIQENPLNGDSVTVTYNRDGLEYEAVITPKEYRVPMLGFACNVACVKATGFDIIKYGAIEVKYFIRTTVQSLKQLITGRFGIKDLSGPVGVVDVIGDTYEQSKSQGMLMVWMNMLNMAVLLSANLGVMNLLPIPALDGGRLVFLIIEAIRKKPLNREAEGMIHFAGLMLLMLLMVVVMYQDIMKIL